MLINLINKLLNDEDGISEDAYLALANYLSCENSYTNRVLRSLTKHVKSANGRYYLSQDLSTGETINE